MKYAEIRKAITPARLTAFDQVATAKGASQDDAVELYEWNAELASALLLPLHLFEVVLRNAVHEAITLTYREDWPWDIRFVTSVPRKVGLYSARWDLEKNSQAHSTTGKVIPELKFAFWEQMFQRRYDNAIWSPLLPTVFPHAPVTSGVPAAARAIRNDIEVVRRIRNRVAHHEPIFSQDIPKVIDAIHRVTAYRSDQVGDWVKNKHRVTTVQGNPPTWYV